MGDHIQQGYDAVFLELFHEIKNKLLYIIAVTVLTGLIGWLYASFFIPPEYEASINLIVNTKADTTGNMSNDDISSAQKLANTYSIIIKSNIVLEQVNQKLNMNLTYEQLYELVDVSALDNTQVMKISARSHKKEEAEAIVTMISVIAPDIVADAVEAGSCKVISKVQAGDEPVYPNVGLITIISGLFGCALCFAVVVFEELLHDYIIDDIDAERKLGVRTLGIVPEIDIENKRKSRRNRRIKYSSEGANAIMSVHSPFSYREAYKMIRTNLEFLSSVKKRKSILITSTLPDEGKSTTAVNLAITLAEKNNSVILVECDMRKPVIRTYLKIRRSVKGLSFYLTDRASLEECIVSLEVEKVNLDVMPAGDIPPNSPELLHQERMEGLIRQLEQQYDYVILDAPPAAVVADAAILSNMADGTLLIIRSKFAQVGNIRQAKQRLESVGSTMLGAIITRADRKKERWRLGYDYDEYGYGKKQYIKGEG